MNLRVARKTWARMHDESESNRAPLMYLGRRAIVRLCRGRSRVTRDAFGMSLGEMKRAWNERAELPW